MLVSPGRVNLLKSLLPLLTLGRIMNASCCSFSGTPNPPKGAFAQNLLQELCGLQKPQFPVDLKEFLDISERFPHQVTFGFSIFILFVYLYSLFFWMQFGIDTCRVKSQPKERQEIIGQQIASAYPVIHERALLLYINFLEHKSKYGSSIEQQIYKDMSLSEFVQRLLAKRCVWFFGSNDSYRTMNGSTGWEGFEAVGGEGEKAPLTLSSVLSYDEMKLSALLYVSTHSEFINDGSRNNAGRVETNKSRIEGEGVIIGLIGARFERPNVMEYQDMMITESQNTPLRGYGGESDGQSPTGASDLRRVWREFYNEPRDFLYGKLPPDNGQRFERVAEGYFDHQVMRKRYAVSFDTLLLEAQDRAARSGKPAYIHVVGIGLGVWQVSEGQERTFLEAFEERLQVLGERLTHIGVVHFSWFHLPGLGTLHDGALLPLAKHPLGGIRIRISRRNPNEKLAEDMLPVVTYAWDGNSLPGNEFWANVLVGTGDPAAACSTLISELQNPHINTAFMSGANLHIASVEHGLVHVGDYARRLIVQK
ncbi:hypothetical protein KR009_011113 [Drosophila setifemur]|nr:hypothetical protein KR009_011113 [Drosophila setifemur]